MDEHSAPARGLHLLTASVAGFAVVLQLILVLDGHTPLGDTAPPETGTAVIRFFSYFTILSNLMVLVSEATLAGRLEHESRAWRVLRLDAVVCIAVTGVVHWFLLRPLLDLGGVDLLADTLLHVVVPVLAVGGWFLVGPRRQVRAEDLPPALVFPLVFVGWTLLHGALSGWYPYPFLDVGEVGYTRVTVNSLGIFALLIGLMLGANRLDPSLASAADRRAHKRRVARVQKAAQR